MSSTEILLREVVDDLAGAGFDVGVFGGWAEELLGLAPTRAHRDIDLLVVNPELPELDAFVAERGEVVAKRLSHKRAYIASGVLVELFLVSYRNGSWATDFWGVHEHLWPALVWTDCRGLPVAPGEALVSYRSSYPAIHSGGKRA